MRIGHARAQVVFTMTYFLVSGLWGLQTIVLGTGSESLGWLVVAYMAVDMTWIWTRPELKHVRTTAVLFHHVGAIFAVSTMFLLDTVRYSGFLLTLELSGFMLHVLWHFRFEPSVRRALERINAILWMSTRFVVPGIAVIILYFDSVPAWTKVVVYTILFVGLMPVQVYWTVINWRRGFRVSEKFVLFGREEESMAVGAIS